MQVSRQTQACNGLTVQGEHWRGSLSDRVLIAENRCAAFFVSPMSPDFETRIGTAACASVGMMAFREYLAGVALAVSLSTASGAAQRTIVRAMEACPNVKDFTDWFEATEKGDASRAVDIIDGKGCVEVNKGEMVEFERLLTNPFVVCVRPIGQGSVSGHRRSQFHHNRKNVERRAARRFGKDAGYASSSWAITADGLP